MSDASQHTIDVRVEAPSPEAFARAYEGHLGPRSIFVPAHQQPALGSRVALSLVTGDGAHLLDVKGRVTWRYEKGRAPPGRKVGFGLELTEPPVGMPCIIEAMKTAPSPAFAPPGTRVPPVGVTGRAVSAPARREVRPLPAPLDLRFEEDAAHLVAVSFSLRPAKRGTQLIHLERFGWPAAGTARERSGLSFDEPTDEAADIPPLYPEFEVGDPAQPPLKPGELASFEDDVTDPGRVSRFVANAIASSSREPAEAPVTDPSLRTMDDLEPLYVRSEEGDEDDETSTDAQIPIVTEDAWVPEAPAEAADDSDEEATEKLPAPPPAAPGVHSDEEDDEPALAVAKAVDEEEPARVLTAPRTQAPLNTRAVLVAWPGRPAEVAVDVGTPLPASVRREVGTGGARHVELAVFEATGAARSLLGIARFDVEEEGAVFEVEVRADADGQVVVKGNLPGGLQRVVFRRSAAQTISARPVRPGNPAVAGEPGIMGKLRRFFGN